MLTPRPHQIEAIQANIEAFKTQTRIKNIMACGTGKTFVFIKTIEELIELSPPDDMQNIIIFAPTIMLVQQIAKTTISHFGRTNFDYAIICSKKKAGELDDISVNEVATNLKIKVLSSQKGVSKAIEFSIVKRKIIFCTYKSSFLLAGKSLDFAVFDESHRTAGELDKPYSFALHDENVLIKKRLFVTATEKVAYRQTSHNVDRIGMNNPKYYGETVYSLPFKTAIDSHLIADYKVLITVVQHSDIAHLLSEESDVLEIANRFALEKAYMDFGISKIITFHSSIERAKNFSTLMNENSPIFSSFHVSGEQDADERQENLQKFIQANHSIVTNARCLTEGIDSPIIDAVAFLDARSSTIEIVQAVGRTQRIAKDKKFGYVILPLYVDNYSQALESNFSDNSSFKNIIDILGVLRNEDDDLRAGLSRSRERNPESLVFDNIVVGSNNLNIDVDQLFNSISVEVATDYDTHFSEMLGLLDDYVKKYGHGYIPENFSERKLSNWASSQRQAHRYKKLPKYREELLLEHEFVFSFFDYEWIEVFNLYQKTDSPLISKASKDENFKKLALWEGRQRKAFRENKLNAFKISKLKSIGFVFEVAVKGWDDSYYEIKDLVNELGSVKAITKKDYPLQYQWINKNKRLLQKEELPKSRAQKISNLLKIDDIALT
ncbi:DEAD/DEAH box helicase [Acinetobacter tianfuensis]|uniref:DEAD/DEAH box helicase n=1 Tax=Acinetobacter tianfuensis TaxID=2419603 RepID=A0A3A8E7F0_9GAMM|nr:DEAD/DEAH box helicase [Acinetobacter tianfuensis]RKG30962.1 DEAD/DEAH box helicase [Acinetobacter tianfuensis]